MTLSKQEKRNSGIFNATICSSSKFRGYLSRTIWLGIRQKARDMKATNTRLWEQLSLDAENVRLVPDLKAFDQRERNDLKRIDLKAAFDKVSAQERQSKQFKTGVTPMHGVLEIGKPDFKKVPKRTWQRSMANSRKHLMRELER